MKYLLKWPTSKTAHIFNYEHRGWFTALCGEKTSSLAGLLVDDPGDRPICKRCAKIAAKSEVTK